MKNKIFLIIVVLCVVDSKAARSWPSSRESLYNSKDQLGDLFALSELLSDVSDKNDIPVQADVTSTLNLSIEDSDISNDEIQFNTAELNILRDNEDQGRPDKVYKEEDQEIDQAESTKTDEAQDDDDGEEDKEEDIEEEEQHYNDDTDIIRRLMIKNDTDVYLQSFVIFLSGLVFGAAVSFFFMSIKNRYRDLKEVQLVLDP